jgi:hypothetical protein
MAKAANNSTTSISRRDAAGLLVGAAACVSAFELGDSVACADTADPVHSAIAAYQAAEADLLRMIRSTAYREMEKRDFEEIHARTKEDRPKVEIGRSRAFSVVYHENDGDRIEKVADSEPLYLYNHESIDEECDKRARKTRGDTAKCAQIEEDRARWHADLAAQESEFEKRLGRPPIDEEIRTEYDRVVDREADARYKLVSTSPVTLAGAAALVRYIYGRTDFVNDPDLVWPLLETLDRAFQRFAFGSVKEAQPRYRPKDDEDEAIDEDEQHTGASDEC